jgi:hypothetical protein
LGIYRRYSDDIDRSGLTALIGDDTAGGIAAIDGGAKHEESMGFSGTAVILERAEQGGGVR